MLHALPLLAATPTEQVTHGTSDAGDPAVVAVVDAHGTTGCSGTIIAPHLVLTAAHCIVPELRTGAHVVLGQTVSAPAATLAIRALRIDPAYDATTHAHDAALLVLGASAPVTPIGLASFPPAVGDTLPAVGWGDTSGTASDTGTKRSGTERVTAVDALTFTVVAAPSQPCAGDSGGPAFEGSGPATVVGVTSFGDAACAQSATYTRVDVVASSFVGPTAAELAPGLVAAGGPCVFPERCQGGADACVVAPDDANVSYCTASCSRNADCPGGMLCVPIRDRGLECRYPFPSPGAMGSACASDLDCAATSCLQGLCTQSCSAVSGGCPSGYACASRDGVDYVCMIESSSAGGSACALSAGRQTGEASVFAVLAAAAGWVGRRRLVRRRCAS